MLNVTKKEVKKELERKKVNKSNWETLLQKAKITIKEEKKRKKVKKEEENGKEEKTRQYLL